MSGDGIMKADAVDVFSNLQGKRGNALFGNRRMSTTRFRPRNRAVNRKESVILTFIVRIDALFPIETTGNS